MKLIGLTGYAGVGKDEAAKVLIEEFGFTRIAFADKMREAMYKLNPVITVDREEWRDAFFIRTLRELVDSHGWDDAKRQYPEIRRLLQVFGTECGREVHGENCWVDAAFRKVQFPNNYVFTDVRFPNEAARIRAEGGLVIKIDRPGVTPVNAHVSDAGLPSHLIDDWILNDGTVEELAAKVRLVPNHWGWLTETKTA